MRKLTLFIFVLMSSCGYAQKQFNNGFSLSVGTEFIPEEKYVFEYYYIFTPKPMFGISLSYDRKLGKYISLGIGTGWFYGSQKDEILGWSEPELNEMISIKNKYSRVQVQMQAQYWAIQNRKYAFTPGILFTYGRTLTYSYFIEVLDGGKQDKTNHHYTNLAVTLGNRFLLKRFSSERKGRFGSLHLILTPYFAANVHRNLDWQSTFFDEPPFDPLFGVGLWLGLQYSF
jgi:hypothetical protein